MSEIDQMRKALEFYADPDGDGYRVDVTDYGLSTEEGEIVRDGGKRARDALATQPATSQEGEVINCAAIEAALVGQFSHGSDDLTFSARVVKDRIVNALRILTVTPTLPTQATTARLKEAIARIIDAEAMQVDAVTGTGKPFSGSVRESAALAKAIAILDLIASLTPLTPPNNLSKPLARLIEAIDDLMGQSSGVAGLHQNGAVADWQELGEGGAFSPWIGDQLHDARAALALSQKTAL